MDDSDSSDEEGEQVLGAVTHILLNSDTGEVHENDLCMALLDNKKFQQLKLNLGGRSFCNRTQTLVLPTSEAEKLLEVGTVNLPSHAGGLVTFRNASEDEPRAIPSIQSFKSMCQKTDISRKFCRPVVLVPNAKSGNFDMTSDQLARYGALHGATDLLAVTIKPDSIQLLFDSEKSGEILRQHVRERGCLHVGEYRFGIVGAEKEQVVKTPEVGPPLPLFLPGRLDIRPGDAIIPTLQELNYSRVGTTKFGKVGYETWVVDTFKSHHRRLSKKTGRLDLSQWKFVPIVVNPAAKALLESVPAPLCVISAFGSQRQGKSSLMRFLSEKFSGAARGGGFRVSSELHSCTQGAWISSSAVKVEDNEGRTWNVLIVDTEGCDQAGGPNLHSTAFWSRLAGTVTMISSVVLLNQVCPTGISDVFFTMVKKIYDAMFEGLGAEVMSCLSGANLVLVARDLTRKQFEDIGYTNAHMWYEETKIGWEESLKEVFKFFWHQQFVALPKAPSVKCKSPIVFAETTVEFQDAWPPFETYIRSVLRPPVMFGSDARDGDLEFMSGGRLVGEWHQLKLLLSGDLAKPDKNKDKTEQLAGSTTCTEMSIPQKVQKNIMETREQFKKDQHTQMACKQMEFLAASPSGSLDQTWQKMDKLAKGSPVPLQSQVCVNKDLAVETYAAQVWKVSARAIKPGGVDAWLRQCCEDAGQLSRAKLSAALLVLVDEEKARIAAAAQQWAQEHCERSLLHSERLEQVVGRLSVTHRNLLDRHENNILVQKSTEFLPAFWNMKEFGDCIIVAYERLGQAEIDDRQHSAYQRLLSQLLNEVSLRLVGVSFRELPKVEKTQHGYRLGSQVSKGFCGWLTSHSDVPKPHATLVMDRIDVQMRSELCEAALQFPEKQGDPLFYSLIAKQLHTSWATDLCQIRTDVLRACTTQSGGMVVRMKIDPPRVASEHVLTKEDKAEIQSQMHSLDEAKVDVKRAVDIDKQEKQQVLATLEDDNATLRSQLTAAFTSIRTVFRAAKLPDPLHIKNTHRLCYRVMYDSPEAAEPLQNLQNKQRKTLDKAHLRLEHSDSLWSLGAVLWCDKNTSDLETLRALVLDARDLEPVEYPKPDPRVCCVVVRLLADADSINIVLQANNAIVLTCSELLCELNEDQRVNFEQQVTLSDLLYYTRQPRCHAAVLPDDTVRIRLGFKKLEIPEGSYVDMLDVDSDSDDDPGVTDYSQPQQAVPELTQWVPREAFDRCEKTTLQWADFSEPWLTWDWKPKDFLDVWHRTARAAKHTGTTGQYHQASRQLLTLVGMVTRAALVRGNYMPSDKASHDFNELQKNEMKVPEVPAMKVLVLDPLNLIQSRAQHFAPKIKIPKPIGTKKKSRRIEFVRLRSWSALIRELRQVRVKDNSQPYSSGVIAVVLHHTQTEPQEMARVFADCRKRMGLKFICVDREDAKLFKCHWTGLGSLASAEFKLRIQEIRDARLKAMAVVGDETESYKLFGRDRKYLVSIPAITAPIELVDIADIALLPAEQELAPQGTIRVVNEDCLDVAEKHAQLGKTEGQKFVPIVLNMANAFHAGGGFERGATAQEEDLCRRTNFYSCFGNAGADNRFYPMKNPLPNMFSSRIVRGVSVIRNRAGLGYSFRRRPFQVDLLCAACFQDGKFTKSAHTEGNEKVCNPAPKGGRPHLRTEVMALTRRKFEVMLSAAATLSKANGRQPLVLCAIGTGAFKNPSSDIAAILGEVVPWFAKYFTEVTFAIIGSPKGHTYHTFCQEFQRLRTPPKLGNKMYFALPPCEYGALCYKLDDSVHTGAVSHPPWCHEHVNCARIKDPVHSVMAGHRQLCSQRAQCQRMRDPVHSRYYTHPEVCGTRNCTNNTPNHRRDRWHPPECKDGPVCAKRKDHKHSAKFSHIRKPCRQGFRCQQVFVDPSHAQQVTHPFADPCNTLAYCNDDSQTHLASFSHVCPYGEQCTHLEKANSPSARQHFATFVHVLDRRCVKYSNCKNFGEWHLSTFSHKGVKDFRPCCHKGDACHKQTDENHVKGYAHPPSPLPPVDVKRRTWVSQYDAAGGSAPVVLDDNDKSNRVTFHYNTSQLEKKAVAFLKKAEPGFDPFSAQVLGIAARMRGWNVSHRCNRDKLESMLQLGQVVSLETMSVLSNDKNLLQQVAKQREPLYSFFLSLDSGASDLSHCDKWLSAVIDFECISFQKSTHDPSAGGPAAPADGEIAAVQDKIWTTLSVFETTFQAAKSRKNFAKRLCKMTFKAFCQEATASIKTVVTTGLKLGSLSSKAGVQYEVDQKIGTHRTVFGVLGPHLFKNYGTITLILKPEILEHPDSYLLPQCATAYWSAAYKDRGRPWSWPEAYKWPKSKTHFEGDKLHPCVRAPDNKHTYPDLFRALAIDFIARVHHEKKKLPSSITYADIQQLQTKWSAQFAGNHNLCEAHLPKEFNMRYVKGMVLTNAVHKLLQKSTLELLSSYGIQMHITSDDAAALKESERLGWEGSFSRPAGMTIGLAPGKPAMSGLKRVRNKPFCVYWCATQGDFELTLSSKNVLKQVARSSGNIKVTFRYDASTHQTKVSVTYRSVEVRRKMRCMLHPSAGIGWGVEAHLGKKPRVVVRFWGPSEFATTPITVSLKEAAGPELRNIQYFGFSNIGSISLAIRYLHMTMSPMTPTQYNANKGLFSWFQDKSSSSPQYQSPKKQQHETSHRTPHYSHNQKPPHHASQTMCDLCGEKGHATHEHRCRTCNRSGRHLTSRCPGTCPHCSTLGMHRESLCAFGEVAPKCKLCPRGSSHTTEQHKCNTCSEYGDHAMQNCPHGLSTPSKPLSPTTSNLFQGQSFSTPGKAVSQKFGGSPPQKVGASPQSALFGPLSPFNFSASPKPSVFATDHCGGGGGAGKKQCKFCSGGHPSEKHSCSICKKSGVHRARHCPQNWSSKKKRGGKK